jgi:cysteine synthase
MDRFYEDITKIVGNIPLVRINRMIQGMEATVVAKRPENKGKLIVIILPDTEERYISSDV